VIPTFGDIVIPKVPVKKRFVPTEHDNAAHSEVYVTSTTYTPATTTALGAVIVPVAGNLDVDVSGNISVPLATTTTVGVVKIPTSGNLTIDGSGNVSVPTTSAGTLGVLKLGVGLTDVGGGVINVTGGTPGIHNLVDTVNHPVTGLTIGHYLKATGATTYEFADLPSPSAMGAIADPGTSVDYDILIWNGATGDAVYGESKVSINPGTGLLMSDNDIIAYGSGGGGAGGWTFRYSLVSDGSFNVNLVNDSAAPGPSKVYGTDGAGTRGWITAPTTMTYPGAGIALSTGSAWGTSITNNSANWNTAYGWGNHASAGYYVGTNSTIRGLFSSSATGLTYTNSTGIFSLSSGYVIPTTTEQSNWNTAYGWGNHGSVGYAVKATDETITGTWIFTGADAYGGGFLAAKFDDGDLWLTNGIWISFGTDVDSYINWSGDQYFRLSIQSYAVDTAILFEGKDAGGTLRTLAMFKPRSGCELYYTGTKRFETNNYGATVVGQLYLTDSSSTIEKGSTGALKQVTAYGYVEIGAQNSSYCHFETDRSAYYFDHNLVINEGIISSYDEDFILKRAGTTKLTFTTTSATFEQTVYSKGDVIAYST